MRVLITGASGFVGTRLAAHLAASGDHVAGTFVGELPGRPSFESFPADITDRRAVGRIVDEVAPEGVIHLAGLSHVGASWDRIPDYFRVNVLGTRNILQAAGDLPVVVASSAEVYGLVPEEDQPIVETTRLDPRNPYAMSKAAAELLAQEHGAIMVRSFNLIGPGQAPNFALPSFARQLAKIATGEAEPVLEVGNLEARRDFLHVDDALDAYQLVLREGRPGEAYNLGTGQVHSIRRMLEILMEVSGVEATTRVDPKRFRPVDVPMTCADISRMSALGWSPRRRVSEALDDLWRSIEVPSEPAV